MTDIITYCDIIKDCAECPRYGDDCNGDKRIESEEDEDDTIHDTTDACD